MAENEYKCDKCGMGFDSQENLDNHVQEMHEE